MIGINSKGDYKNTESFLSKILNRDGEVMRILNKYGAMGVSELSANTPKDTGRTASSWSYTINKTRGGYSIQYSNSSTTQGIPIVILLQYGHATNRGGYVLGQDFINPVIRPVAAQLLSELSEGVAK
ncbi:MAG TPA: HK97 gp10 family phage protein [Clostridia bacterium]|nr:HK97 gp10 family phage protein [Clostridia bacterium]